MPDGTIYAGISPTTGTRMFVTPADAPELNWQEASDYARRLDEYGHKDWRLPTKAELSVLFNNQAAIGGFNKSGPGPWYWSSTEVDGPGYAWLQNFVNGRPFSYTKSTFRFGVRCVRAELRP
ncbi:MAG: DUF1566 domain-containing protein [Propylenella sp.]